MVGEKGGRPLRFDPISANARARLMLKFWHDDRPGPTRTGPTWLDPA